MDNQGNINTMQAPPDQKPAKSKDPLKTRGIIGWGLYGGGNGIFQYMLQSFGQYFYTNIVGLDVLVTGTFMTVCKIIDFITDIIMGALVDNYKNKSGEKARPWLLRGMVPGSIGLILLFSSPFTGGVAKLIWAIATYFLATSICFTMNIIPQQSLLPLMTDQRMGRSKTEVVGALISMVISLLAGITVEPLSRVLGGGKKGWLTTAAILAVIALVFHIIGYLNTKERIRTGSAEMPEGMEGVPMPPKKEKLTAKQFFKELGNLLSNRYYLIMIAMTFLFGLNTAGTTMVYYVQYVVQDMSVLAYMMVLMMAPTMVFLIIAPFVIRKLGKKPLILAGVTCQIIGFVIMWIFPGTISTYIGIVMTGFGTGGMASVQMSFIADAVDYGEYKHGVRNEGFAYSINLSIQKIASALASLVLGIIFAIGGFDASIPAQTDASISSINFAFKGFPLILCVITFILILFLNVEKKYPNMAEDLQRLRKERAAEK